MKKLLNFLLLSVALILLSSFSVSVIAAGSVYELDGVQTVFLSNDATVTYNGTEYTPFASLGDALSALSATGEDSQAIVVGNFNMSDGTKDMTYTMPIKSLTIKGADANAVFNQSSWLEFYTGPVTFDNLTWNGKANKGLAYQDATFTETFKTTGKRQYFFGYDYSQPIDYAKAVVKSGNYILISSFNTTTTVGTPEKNGYVYMQLDGGDSEYYVFAGGNGGSSTVYGNAFLVINGGTYKNGLSNGVCFQKMTVTGKKVALVTNGMSSTVAPIGADILVTSEAGGTVIVDESTLSAATPVLVLTPGSGGYAPFVNGVELEKTDDVYKFALSENGTYAVTWAQATVEDTDEPKNIDIIDGKQTVFLSNEALVTYGGKQYIPYTSLGDALNALSATGEDSQAIVVGNYTMSDGTTSQTYSMPIKSLTIKGADANAIFNQPNIWLEFYTGPITFDNLTWHGAGNQGLDYQDATFTDTFKTTGKTQYFFGYDYKSPVDYIKTVIQGGKFLVTTSFYSTTTVGSPEKNGYVLTQVDGGTCEYHIYCGGNGGSSTVYGNAFLIINGGNITTGHSGGVGFQKMTVTGKKIGILNNGMKEDITMVGQDVLVTSEAGGIVTVDEATLTAASPILVFTPDSEELTPYVNNTPLTKADGKYTYTVSENATLNVTWGAPSEEEETKTIDVIDGKQTVFLSNNPTITYKGKQYTAYASLTEALNALSATGEDSQAIVVGNFTMSDGTKDMTYTMPINSLTIKGADSSAVFNQDNWIRFITGPVTFDNLTWNGRANKGLAYKDATFTETFKTSGKKQYFFGYDHTSPVDYVKAVVKGGNYLVISSFYGSTTVGSATKNGYAYLQLDGGDSEYYVFAGGNSGTSTVYGNVFLVINGGTYENGTGGNICFNRLGTVTGKKIALVNNGMSSAVAPVGADILIRAEKGGTVAVDETTLADANPVLILTPDEGSTKVPFVSGKAVEKTNGQYRYTLSEDGVFDIGWAEIPEGFYFMNGLPTIFVSNEEKVVVDGVEYLTFSSMTEAMAAVATTTTETQMVVCGNYTPTETTDLAFTAPTGHLTITGLDENAVYNHKNWIKFYGGAVTIKNLKWNNVEVKGIACPDITIADSVTMSGKSLYIYANDASAPLDRITVNVAAGKYIIVSSTYNTVTIGSEEKPGSIYMTLDGGRYEYYVFGGGEKGSSTVYGNAIIEINGGTFDYGLNDYVRFQNIGNITGKKIAILNNGMISKVVPGGHDILVKSAVGGKVSISEATRDSETPVLVFTPDEGSSNVPFVNGKIVDLVEGAYTYTLSANGEYNVEWRSLVPQSYIIDGVKTVFLSDSDVVVDGNNYYVPYSNFTDGLAALGKEGGNAIVFDNFTPVDFTDVAGREKVTVKGFDRFAVIKQVPNLHFNGGPIEFKDLTFEVAEAYTYIGCYDITIGENVQVASTGAGQLYVTGGTKAENVDKVRVTINSGKIAQVGAGGLHNGFVIGSPEKRTSSIVTINGGDLSNSYVMAGGAYRNTTTYGNIYIIVNGGNFGSERTLLNTQLTKGFEDSKIIVLFNGTGPVTSTSAADIVINNEKGGNVTLDESTADTATPVYVLEPEENMIPFVNGEKLEMTGGKYQITVDGTETVYNIVWNKRFDVTFDLNGGEGTIPDSISVIAGQTIELPSDEGFAKADNVFVGWNTDKNATSGIDVINSSENNVLYAIWKSVVPALSDKPNLEANGVVSVLVEHEKLTEDEIDNAVQLALNDPVFLGTANAEYVFKITAFDENGNVVNFENGINFVIPEDVCTITEELGKFVNIYNVYGGNATLIEEVEKTEEGISFTAYNSGIIVVAANTPDVANYIYTVDEADGKVYVNFYYNGKPVQSGFFGVHYKTNALENATFEYAEGLISAGGALENGGFGIYKNERGRFFDAFELATENGAALSIGSTDTYTLIGTLTFDKLADDYSIEPIDNPEELFSEYTYGKGLVYVPYCQSQYTHFQPATINLAQIEAYIADKCYGSLEEAVANSVEGDTIVLFKDAVIEQDVALKDGTSLKLDAELTGAKIKLSETSKVYSDTSVLAHLTADTLVAYNYNNGVYEYVASPYSADYLVFDGAQVRTSVPQGLRFIATINSNLEECALTDYGFIVIPEDLSELGNTDHFTDLTKEISLKLRGDDFRYFEKTEESFSFTLCLTNIMVKHYDRNFMARPFLRYEKDGVEYTAYTEYESKYNLSVYDVANGLLENDPNTSCKDALQAIIKEYDEYVATNS